LANDGIEAGVAECQRLTVGDYRSIGRRKSGAGRPEHRGRDVRSNNHARIAHQGDGRDSGFACSGGNIEHPMAEAYFRSR